MSLADLAAGYKSSSEEPSEQSAEQFRGSADVPLNAKGFALAARAAKETAGQFTKIYSSPLKRAMRTAEIVGYANPQAGAPQPTEALTPWYLGAQEGKEVTPERVQMMKDHITKTPDLPMEGRASISTQPGQSFNDFKRPVLQHIQEQLVSTQPGEKILNVSHYRDIRLLRAWLVAGAKPDGSISNKEMLQRGTDNPGDLFHLNPKNLSLTKVHGAEEPGIYFLRHGDTDLNVRYGGAK